MATAKLKRKPNFQSSSPIKLLQKLLILKKCSCVLAPQVLCRAGWSVSGQWVRVCVCVCVVFLTRL